MLELKNITYKVIDQGKEKVILDDISCVFDDNCVTAITGQNGGGKSTVTKIIMGIIKQTSGKIYYNGKEISSLSINERANLGIGYAFQQPVLFKGLTIKDLIDIASGQSNSVSKACEYLSRVGLCAKEYIGRVFDKSLSGGEQKRIEIALALAKNSQLVIFDEPEAGIDLWGFDKLNSLFVGDKSYIIVSHQEKILSKADKIIVINDGKIVDIGDSKSIISKLNKDVCGRILGGKHENR